jgi:nucleoside-diphosphate-sugar epimerase
MEVQMDRTALVLGATGGVGGETARALIARGWRVRGLVRGQRPGLDPAITWIAGDASDPVAVMGAAEGTQAIVHAVNPPGYRDWDRLVLPMIDNSIAAAKAHDARLVLPGTVYNYDPVQTPVAAPDSPQRARARKGRIRIELERRIEVSGIRALILRAGDFYGPRPGNSWFSQGMITPGKPVQSVLLPGFRGIGHGWAYLPDLAATFARLLDREAELPRFARYHFAGNWDAEGGAFAAAIVRAAGTPPRTRRFPWWALPLIAPFHPTMREMIEMRPYWRHPLRLDNRTLVEMLGEEPRTPLDTAMRETLRGLGCL